MKIKSFLRALCLFTVLLTQTVYAYRPKKACQLHNVPFRYFMLETTPSAVQEILDFITRPKAIDAMSASRLYHFTNNLQTEKNLDTVLKFKTQIGQEKKFLASIKRTQEPIYEVIIKLIEEVQFREEFLRGVDAIKERVAVVGTLGGETPPAVSDKIKDILTRKTPYPKTEKELEDNRKALEGDVAHYIDTMWGGVLGINQSWYDRENKKHYEIDIRLANALIEVTSQSSGKMTQIFKSYFSDFINPQKRPVILYAENYSTPAGIGIMKAARERGVPFVVARSRTDLSIILSEIMP